MDRQTKCYSPEHALALDQLIRLAGRGGDGECRRGESEDGGDLHLGLGCWLISVCACFNNPGGWRVDRWIWGMKFVAIDKVG